MTSGGGVGISVFSLIGHNLTLFSRVRKAVTDFFPLSIKGSQFYFLLTPVKSKQKATLKCRTFGFFNGGKAPLPFFKTVRVDR